MDNLNIQENISLKEYTSMYVGGPARYFVEVRTPPELKSALNFSKEKHLPVFILGGGSNVLVSDKGFTGLVIRIQLLGVEKISEGNEIVRFRVSAGESWDKFVGFCVENNFYGVENLSHIPGTVGASVVQNIGAYGQEVSSSVVSVEVLDRDTLKEKTLTKENLNFSYRKSILNDSSKDKNRYVVTSVLFELKKKQELLLEYADIKKYFENQNITPDLKSIREAIIKIRDSKFPYPDSPEHGTAGSFWNAETVDSDSFENIIQKLDKMGFGRKADEMRNKKSAFTVAQGFKVPYGVLVEVLGFKGKVFGNAKILETHSCVINNFTGRATANEIVKISSEVLEKVFKEFGVRMKIEPELVGDF